MFSHPRYPGVAEVITCITNVGNGMVYLLVIDDGSFLTAP